MSAVVIAGPLFKEYFGLTAGETIKTWSAMETVIAVARPVATPLLSQVPSRAASWPCGQGNVTVTRRKSARMRVVSTLPLWFCATNRASSSRCNSPSRPSFAAASKAFMVGP